MKKYVEKHLWFWFLFLLIIPMEKVYKVLGKITFTCSKSTIETLGKGVRYV